MNARGQYGGSAAQGRVQVGAFLVHTLELKQRYNNVKTAAVQSLLNELSSVGSVLSTDTNRWEIALKAGTWVQLTWHPDSFALEITITDRELRPVDQLAATRRRYETLLHNLTPRLQKFGATTVGAAIADVHSNSAPAFGTYIGLAPETLKEDLERLNDEVRELQEKMTDRRAEQAMQGLGRTTQLEVFFQKSWLPFVTSWRRYYDDLKRATDVSWRASVKVIEAALSDWQSKLIDQRADALSKMDVPGPEIQPAPGPAVPVPGPTPHSPVATVPTTHPVQPAPSQPVQPAPSAEKGKAGLYVALGLGAIAVTAAAVMSFRHAGTA